MTDDSIEDHQRLIQRLNKIKRDLEAGEDADSVTVRELLSWMGAKRRGYWIATRLRTALEKIGLDTVPDFESAFIDSHVEFAELAKAPVTAEPAGPQTADASSVQDAAQPSRFDDPTYRVSKLEAANRAPLSIRPDATIAEAITKMLANDFSQLPVMTTERDVKGIVTWKSLGTRLGLGRRVETAQSAADTACIVAADDSMFDLITEVLRHEAVLVRAKDRKIIGIITPTDLTEQFRQLTEPFLLLSEIENQIRGMIDAKFNTEDLIGIREPGDAERSVEAVSDLTFGEYVRLLQNPESWRRLALNLDRASFVAELDTVRKIRNDIMHFDPDGIPPEDLATLQRFTRLMQTLAAVENC